MDFSSSNTIVAISTPPGRGGIAVARICGPQAIAIANALWKGLPLADTPSHTARVGYVLDAQGAQLDQAVATVFRAPRSFTGEDTVEFAVHGSLYVQRELLNSAVNHGARIAEPGEFTRRAFVNGKLDLAEAEAVADIIASSSRAAHKLASSQLQGQFSAHVNSLRDKLITLSSLLELELDFSEEDVEFANRTQLRDLCAQVLDFVDSLTATFHSGQALRDGVPVAIIGRPNAGKSSLLNALVGTDRAIVSDIPGTTRDTIEDTVDIKGITFRFIDTAGIRRTDDPIESLGIDRTFASAKNARAVIWMISPEQSDEEIAEDLVKINATMTSDSTLITVHSKSDLLPCEKKHTYNTPGAIAISAISGIGLDDLRQLLTNIACEGLPADESMIVTNARHYAALLSAKTALQTLMDGLSALTTDLLAEHLREAIEALGSITGQITSSEVLQTIFSRFCIGK